MTSDERPLRTVMQLITPDMARQWLARNVANRSLSEPRVLQLAGAIRRGEWRTTHQGIAFDPDGNLRDGQHRLAAIIKANQPVTMMVTYGLEPESVKVVDVGSARTASNVLTMAGEHNAAQLAASLRTLYDYRRALGSRDAKTPTHGQLVALLEQNPGLRRIQPDARVLAKELKIRPGPTAASMHLVLSEEHFAAAEFMRGVTQGTHLEAGDPRLALRRVLTQAPSRPDPLWIVGLFGKAWLAFQRNRPIRVLSFKDGESMPRYGKIGVSV